VEVVASLSQGRTAAAQCGLFTYKSVPVIFEPPCTTGPSLGTLKESKAFSDISGRWMEQCLHSVCQLEMSGRGDRQQQCVVDTQIITADCLETADDVFQRIVALGLARHMTRLWEV